jgi:hypothetical protein
VLRVLVVGIEVEQQQQDIVECVGVEGISNIHPRLAVL